MRRSFRFGRLLIAAAVALCLGSPSPPLRAQSQKAGPDAQPGEKSSAQRKSLPQVSILNLQVIKPDPALADQPPHMRNVRRFNMPYAAQEGTTLVLLIDDPEQWILSLETRDCKITKFRDDRDTDLAQPKAAADGGDVRFNPQPGPENCTLTGEVDQAGHRATVTVHSPNFPAGGANRLSLEADLVMKFGHGEKTVEQKNVNLKLDTITVAPSPLLVMTQEPSGLMEGHIHNAGMQVILFHQGPLQREIRKVAFIDPHGEEIQARAGGSGQSGSIHQAYYSLTRKVETCTVRLTVPEKIEKVTLSFAIDTGVGFPPGARRRTLRSFEPHAKVTDTPEAQGKSSSGHISQKN
jgi:hypothetical protein